MPNRIENLKKQLAEAKTPQAKADLERQLKAAQDGWEQLKEIKPTPPNITYSKKKVINLGGREVQLLFLGRGHTNGDTVVFLPKEKIVCTGDLMESQIAYMGDAQFDEWVTTLEALKKLDFETDLAYLPLIRRRRQNQSVFELPDTRFRPITATSSYISIRYNAVAPSFMQCPHVRNVDLLADTPNPRHFVRFSRSPRNVQAVSGHFHKPEHHQ